MSSTPTVVEVETDGLHVRITIGPVVMLLDHDDGQRLRKALRAALRSLALLDRRAEIGRQLAALEPGVRLASPSTLLDLTRAATRPAAKAGRRLAPAHLAALQRGRARSQRAQRRKAS